MYRRIVIALTLGFVVGSLACGPTNPRTETPGPVADAAAEPEAGPAPAADTPAAGQEPVSGRWVATLDNVTVNITDGPGVLMDTSAPPPPPGVEPALHPFLGAACGGDPVGCSKAGELLRASTSTQDYLDRLRAAGYTVTPQP